MSEVSCQSERALSLRPYQNDIIIKYREASAAGKRRVLIVAPTGAGRTILAVAIILDALVNQGKRVQFLAHRRELIVQASRKLYAAGCDHGILLPVIGTPVRASPSI